MKWFSRSACGDKYHEYRNEESESYSYLFDIEVKQSGKIRLYDLRDNPATYYVGFDNLRHAKKIAIESITNKEVLKPFYDKEWYDMSARTASVMERTEELLKSLREENEKSN